MLRTFQMPLVYDSELKIPFTCLTEQTHEILAQISVSSKQLNGQFSLRISEPSLLTYTRCSVHSMDVDSDNDLDIQFRWVCLHWRLTEIFRHI